VRKASSSAAPEPAASLSPPSSSSLAASRRRPRDSSISSSAVSFSSGSEAASGSDGAVAGVRASSPPSPSECAMIGHKCVSITHQCHIQCGAMAAGAAYGAAWQTVGATHRWPFFTIVPSQDTGAAARPDPPWRTPLWIVRLYLVQPGFLLHRHGCPAVTAPRRRSLRSVARVRSKHSSSCGQGGQKHIKNVHQCPEGAWLRAARSSGLGWGDSSDGWAGSFRRAAHIESSTPVPGTMCTPLLPQGSALQSIIETLRSKRGGVEHASAKVDPGTGVRMHVASSECGCCAGAAAVSTAAATPSE
jgi:hypothetical protein